ncbi:MAG TPA: hypothetical protein VMF69_07210, partial [Gemmataceae bacterium]|nr:hypothetical protein [Gemmataceae bacterium]
WLNGPPSQGFFRIWQSAIWQGAVNNLGPTLEGSDLDGIGSYISANQFLAFTIKKRGNDMGEFLSANVSGVPTFLTASASFGPAESRYQGTSGGSYNYQWAEVAWFLQPQINPTTSTQDTTAPDPTVPALATGGVPLYTLYRRQCLLVPDNSLVTAGSGGGIPIAQAANCLELSCWANGTNLYFNSPIDITVPWRRFGMLPVNTANLSYPAGLLYATAVNPTPLTLWTQLPWVSSNPSLSLVPSLPPTYVPATTPVGPLYPTPYYPTLAQQAAGTLSGADIQLNDVVSFDVRVLLVNPTTGIPEVTNPTNPNDPFVTLFMVPNTSPTTYYNANPAFYNPTAPTTNPSAPAVFDTWSSISDGLSNYSAWNVSGLVNATPLTSIPMWNSTATPLPRGPIIQAIQISIRLWDFKTNQTRQVTIVQAM